MSIYDHIDDFKSAIADAGIEPPCEVTPDGELHRFSSNGKAGDKAGYYTFFTNPNGTFGGCFGCWREGIKGTWLSSTTNNPGTFAPAQMEILRQAEALKRQQMNSERAGYAQHLYSEATDIPLDHPYIVRKSIKQLGDARYINEVRCADFFMDENKRGTLTNCIVIPVFSELNELKSLQVITSDGTKFFLKGGKLDGGRLILNGDNATVYICEGFATGVTIHEAIGSTVVVAFNAGGIGKVAPSIVSQYPDSKVIIAADNDHRKAKDGKVNTGLDVAKSVADELQIAYTYPEFEESDNGTDWNDFALQRGVESTKTALLENQQQVEPELSFADFNEALQALVKDGNDEEAFDAAICFIKDGSTLQAGRMRAKLKEISGVNITEINKAISIKKQEEVAPELTHSEISIDYIGKFNEPRPISEYGCLWSYSESEGIWRETQLQKVGVEIAQKYKHEKLCRRECDYKAIASHTYNTLEQKGFFENASKGIYTPSGFLFVKENQIKLEPPSPEHRARFRLEIDPDFSQEPKLLLNVLEDAFKGHYPEEQIHQLRMMTGLALFGLQSKEQRAVLLYGAAGSGKSLYLKMIEALVPKEYRTSISPLQMDNDYKNAALAGKRMNLVPEIDKDKPVPSAEFKAIIGGDTMPAREPYGKVFTFTPEAACWFNGNYYLTTKDHSEGFWRRWAIIHFANSKPEQERDPKLLSQIIEQELPAVLAWAIQGVQDYLDNGLYLSSAHHVCIQEWKRDGNSVSSWLHDGEDNGVGVRKQGMSKPPLKLSHAYTIYKDWCRHNNRKPFNKQAFKAHMASNGHHKSLYNGYFCFTGLYDARLAQLG